MFEFIDDGSLYANVRCTSYNFSHKSMDKVIIYRVYDVADGSGFAQTRLLCKLIVKYGCL